MSAYTHEVHPETKTFPLFIYESPGSVGLLREFYVNECIGRRWRNANN